MAKTRSAMMIIQKDKIYQKIEKDSLLIVPPGKLFVINDIIADERLDKRGKYLLQLPFQEAIYPLFYAVNTVLCWYFGKLWKAKNSYQLS